MSTDRLLCGFATLFGVSSPSDPWVLRSEDFARFVRADVGVPLRVDHGGLVTRRGVLLDIGAVRRFACVTTPADGLLCLAQVAEGDIGDNILHEINDGLRSTWGPGCSWGMSVAAGKHAEDSTSWWVTEVSLTHEPAIEGARILAAGAEALRTWELLIEQPSWVGLAA